MCKPLSCQWRDGVSALPPTYRGVASYSQRHKRASLASRARFNKGWWRQIRPGRSPPRGSYICTQPWFKHFIVHESQLAGKSAGLLKAFCLRAGLYVSELRSSHHELGLGCRWDQGRVQLSWSKATFEPRDKGCGVASSCEARQARLQYRHRRGGHRQRSMGPTQFSEYKLSGKAHLAHLILRPS